MALGGQLIVLAVITGLAAAGFGVLYLVVWFRRGPAPARHRRRR